MLRLRSYDLDRASFVNKSPGRMQLCMLLVMALAALASCLPTSNEAPEGAEAHPDKLLGTEWVLASFGPTGNETAALAHTAVTARFEEGQLLGSTGCNSYSATHQVDSRALTLGPIAVTEMACLDPGVMEQETSFLAALATASSFEVVGDVLTIAYGGGVLRFVPQKPPETAALTDGIWQLETLEEQEGAVVTGRSVPEGMLITVTFREGQLSGSTGCNDFGAPYRVNGSQLTIDGITKTEALCPDEAQILVEGQFFNGLETAESFTLAADQLTIHYPGGSLIFRTRDESGSGAAHQKAEVVPPPAVLMIGDSSQTAGIGTYCWSAARGEETAHFCADMSGIPTAPEPLWASTSPVVAQLTLPLSQEPSHLTVITIPVTDADTQTSTAGGYRWWNFADVEPVNLPLKTEQELVFDLQPGLHVVQISAWWEGVGDVVYGFLLEVEPVLESGHLE